MAVPLVTRSTLEVVLPEAVVPKLVTKSRNKLAQISEVELFLTGTRLVQIMTLIKIFDALSYLFPT